jgi:hypothetical protein
MALRLGVSFLVILLLRDQDGPSVSGQASESRAVQTSPSIIEQSLAFQRRVPRPRHPCVSFRSVLFVLRRSRRHSDSDIYAPVS